MKKLWQKIKIKSFFTNKTVCSIELVLGLCGVFICWLICGSFWGVFGCMFLFTLGICGLFYKKLTKGKNEYYIAATSMVISLICLVIGMDNSAFIQSDGDYKKALNRIFKKDNVIDISDDLNKLDSLPELIIVLDISGSTEKAKVNTENKDKLENIRKNIAEQFRQLDIEEAILNNFLGNEYNEFTINKLKLLEILTEKESSRAYEISIICFGTECYSSKLPLQYRDKGNINPKEAMEFIINSTQKQVIQKDWTDFEKLFDYIKKLYPENHKRKNASEPPQYTFLFFSDYLHDKDETNNKKLEKAKKELEEKISSFYNSFQSFSDFFYFESVINRKTKNDEINVLPILEQYKDEDSKAHTINILKDDKSVHFSNILSKKCMPIYFSNSYPTHDLSTKITFDKAEKANFIFILNSKRENITNYHQQFSLSYLNGKEEPEQLFYPKQVTMGKDKSLELTFSGRVIDPFSCSTLTCYNEKNGCCRFDIVFFKDFPNYVLVCALLLFFFISVFFVSLFIILVQTQNHSCPYLEDKKNYQKAFPPASD